jgi:hypothetical protein
MTIYLNGQQDAFAEFHGEVQALTESTSASPSEPEPTRRSKNVLIWQSYLPHDCVESMVNMGWDHST